MRPPFCGQCRIEEMRPIFIGGCDRSGTTMLGAMLGAGSGNLCTPESQFIVKVHEKAALKGRGNDSAFLARALVDHWRFKIWGLDVAPEEAVSAAGKGSFRDLVEWVVGRYGEKAGRSAPEVWIDHTPWNLRYGLLLDKLFPEGKFIHIVRDGRGVASSVIPLDWGPNNVRDAAHWWLEKLSYGLAAESSLGTGRILRVHYEKLLQDPEGELQRICAFAGIEYQPEMCRGEFNVPGYTARQHRLVGKAPDKGRAEGWVDSLSGREVEVFEMIAGQMLGYLGYRRRSPYLTENISSRENRRFSLGHFFKKNLSRKFSGKKG